MDSDAVVKAKLDDGRVLLVEVRRAGGRERDVGVGELLAFDGVEASISAIAERVTAALRSASPDRASVEFGIDVTLESGALTGLLAKGSGQATLRVTLAWGAHD